MCLCPTNYALNQFTKNGMYNCNSYKWKRVPTKEAVENRKWQMNKDLPFVTFIEVEGVEVNE